MWYALLEHFDKVTNRDVSPMLSLKSALYWFSKVVDIYRRMILISALAAIYLGHTFNYYFGVGVTGGKRGGGVGAELRL